MLPSLKIRNIQIDTPIIQGGMGIGLSNYTLAAAVANQGGLGVLSSAALDRIITDRHNLPKRATARQAAAQDVQDAKKLCNNKPIGMNIMVAVMNQYEDSVLGSIDGGVDVIISGAGLPLSLPSIVNTHERGQDVALVPIVGSGRALDLICKRWQRAGRIPDAVIVEGPKAGGHIAWRTLEEAYAPENRLENLIADVLKARDNWDKSIPVIAAGGIYTHSDILKFLDLGCAGVQMGTRFLATHESGASQTYKEMLVESTKNDIVLAAKKGSPCGMLFRVIRNSPFYQQILHDQRAPKCNKGYVLNKENKCPSKTGTDTMCICNGLLASVSLNPAEKELYTIGSNGYRIDKILSVKELMDELKGETMVQPDLPDQEIENNFLLEMTNNPALGLSIQ